MAKSYCIIMKMFFYESVLFILLAASSVALSQMNYQGKNGSIANSFRRNSKMSKDFSEKTAFVESDSTFNKLIKQFGKSNVTGESNEIPDETDPRIIGGRTANEGEFPWMVALYYNGGYICSASLISKTVVLTAAHCVNFGNGAEPASSFYGIAGSLNRESSQTRIEFSEVIPHSQYGTGSEYDIAILKTSEPVQTSELIQPICLPKGGRDFEHTYVLAMGWGVTTNNEEAQAPEMLMTVELQGNSERFCQAFLMIFLIPITEKHICANSYSSRGVCFGDSGGPLVYDDPMSGRPIEIGVASFVTVVGCGRPVVPSVFSATSAYTDWLTQNAGENGDLCFV